MRRKTTKRNSASRTLLSSSSSERASTAPPYPRSPGWPTFRRPPCTSTSTTRKTCSRTSTGSIPRRYTAMCFSRVSPQMDGFQLIDIAYPLLLRLHASSIRRSSALWSSAPIVPRSPAAAPRKGVCHLFDLIQDMKSERRHTQLQRRKSGRRDLLPGEGHRPG
jgi:hypothetical protein